MHCPSPVWPWKAGKPNHVLSSPALHNLGRAGLDALRNSGRRADLATSLTPDQRGSERPAFGLCGFGVFPFRGASGCPHGGGSGGGAVTRLRNSRSTECSPGTDARNLRAQRLLERIGFRQESEFRESTWFKGARATDILYAQLESEWRPEPSG